LARLLRAEPRSASEFASFSSTRFGVGESFGLVSSMRPLLARSFCFAALLGGAIASLSIAGVSACSSTRSPADASTPDAPIEAVALDTPDAESDAETSVDALLDATLDGAIGPVDPRVARRELLKEFLENTARFHLALSPSMRASFDAKCERKGGAKARGECRAALIDEAATVRAELTRESLFSRLDRPGDPPRFALRVTALDTKGSRSLWHRVGGLVAVDLDRLAMTPDAHDDGPRKIAAPPDQITITAPSATTIEIVGLEPEALVFIRM
jgi:hypothetical protein